jgi:hypothetical protein
MMILQAAKGKTTQFAQLRLTCVPQHNELRAAEDKEDCKHTPQSLSWLGDHLVNIHNRYEH